MPSDTQGFSGTEIVNHVISWIGNTSSDFQSLVENFLPLAEFRYCKLYDWPFLHQQNLSLTVSSGTAEYTLSAANLGSYMAATDVKTIFSVANNRVLEKVTLDQIRRMDADGNEGTTATDIQAWAPVGDNKIVVYPSTFSDTTLKVDGKVTPGALSTLSNYPTVPYRFQEAFMQYIIAKMLDRENDTRAPNTLSEALQLAGQDYQAALAEHGDAADEPRFKHYNEDVKDGTTLNEIDALNQRGW